MAASSIGRTTVITKEYAPVLAKAVREYKAKVESGLIRRRPVPLSEIHAIGHPIHRRD